MRLIDHNFSQALLALIAPLHPDLAPLFVYYGVFNQIRCRSSRQSCNPWHCRPRRLAEEMSRFLFGLIAQVASDIIENEWKLSWSHIILVSG